MLPLILAGIAVLVVLFLIIVALQPNDFIYERSLVMNVSPAAPFEQVNDLHKWQAWSPWAKMDPDAKTTFEGPTAGVGASTSWEGNKTGAGKMTLIESVPNEYIKFRLEFFKPFKGVNTAEFHFTKDTSGTRVTWSMYGKCNFISKLMSLLVNCKEMVNKQFDAGLNDIKKIVEQK